MTDVRNHANLIWGIAELLRGDYKQSQYGDVILPLIVMRRQIGAGVVGGACVFGGPPHA